MADLFAAPRGHVIRAGTGMAIARLSPALSGDGSLLIVSGIAIVRDQVTQYIKTLDNKVFGYAWGEGPGRIIVSGLIFHAPGCSPNATGYGSVNSYYDRNNVYTKGGPCSLSVGPVSFVGYLEKLTFNATMNEFNFGDFTLEMAIIKGS